MARPVGKKAAEAAAKEVAVMVVELTAVEPTGTMVAVELPVVKVAAVTAVERVQPTKAPKAAAEAEVAEAAAAEAMAASLAALLAAAREAV